MGRLKLAGGSPRTLSQSDSRFRGGWQAVTSAPSNLTMIDVRYAPCRFRCAPRPFSASVSAVVKRIHRRRSKLVG